MSHEGGYYRFFAYLNLFMFFMLILVLRKLRAALRRMGRRLASRATCSSLLFSEKVRIGCRQKTFIVNRIGDFGFMLGMFLLFRTFGTLDFTTTVDKVTNQQWPHEGWVSRHPYCRESAALYRSLRANRALPFMSGC